MKKLYSLLLTLIICAATNASEVAQVTAIEAASLDSQQEKVEIGQWNFAVGLGYGRRTNPLYDGKDTPLYLLPSISYYGEQVFFDDGVLGYSYDITPNLSLSAITQLNAHAANFSRWHPSNFFVAQTNLSAREDNFSQSLDVVSPATDEEIAKMPVAISELADRDWTLDAGLQLNYFGDSNWMLQLNLLHDVLNVYNGLNGQMRLEKSWRIKNIPALSLKLFGTLDWHSQKLANYYYGIGERDTQLVASHYSAKSGVNRTLGFSANYHLSSNWRAALSYRLTNLDASIKDSPMVRENHSDTLFVGAVYHF
ncbi:MipA/OmpV family protein [Psychrobium sp. MM17-31]|uniref:MipA/OmpV family protein n=1 Tax=Psychrobium sp. MM17-31 TaxID=2917758 RepID=UPI001EF4CC5D|nr:MipA/OmpV family protein [Psychrobium sp. MM17-31]MCG7529970.1 MipA/OmpV family protein [Psychrobium sp. MM17-31]